MKILDHPAPGFWMMRMAKDAALAAARISYGPTTDPVTGELLDRSWLWTAEINGEPLADPSPDPDAAGVFRIWHRRGEACSEADYRFHVEKVMPWAQAAGAPEARPFEAASLDTAAPLF